MSPTPRVSRETSEEEIIAHHHSTPTPKIQVAEDDYNASRISEKSVQEYHQASASQSSSPTRLKSGTISASQSEESRGPEAKSLPTRIISDSLLKPFAFPVSTPLPTPPTTPASKESTLSDTFFHPVTPQEMIMCKGQDDDYTALSNKSSEPSTPIAPSRKLFEGIHVPDTPLTPSRLGPTWETEIAAPSVADEEELDELDSESDEEDEVNTPYPSPYLLDSQQPLSRPDTETQQNQDEGTDGNIDPNAWAFEHGINPKQGDDALIIYPTHIIQDESDGDGDDESVSEDEHHQTSSDESSVSDIGESEEDSVERVCGYRVFAGWTDLNPKSIGIEDRHEIPGREVGSSSFGYLTPRRPTALEATLGHGHGHGHGRQLPALPVSPGSPAKRVSTKFDAPKRTPLKVGGRPASTYLFDSQFHLRLLPDLPRGPLASGSIPKRDQ